MRLREGAVERNGAAGHDAGAVERRRGWAKRIIGDEAVHTGETRIPQGKRRIMLDGQAIVVLRRLDPQRAPSELRVAAAEVEVSRIQFVR